MLDSSVTPLYIHLDPGGAPSEEMLSLLLDLSRLYRLCGGEGINFKFSDTTTLDLRVWPNVRQDSPEKEIWDVFRTWFLKAFEYMSIRCGFSLARNPVSADWDAQSDYRNVLKDAIEAFLLEESHENASTKKAIDIITARQVEIDLNADVDSMLNQIGNFLQYLEDLYGTRCVVSEDIKNQ